METLALYLPAKLATLFDWLDTRLESARLGKGVNDDKDPFLADLVFFSSEEELAEYVNSFRDEK